MGKDIKTVEGVALTGVTHGLLSKSLVLPWEDTGEYADLLEELRQEHAPVTATEHHLVEELAGIMWRRRRLRIAEGAHYQRAIRRDNYDNVIQAALVHVETEAKPKDFSVKKALCRSEEDNQRELETIAEYREPAIRALELLDNCGTYDQALTVLATGTREWWEIDTLGEARFTGGDVYEPIADHLSFFLRFRALPHYLQEYEEARYRHLIKRQAEAQAFMPEDKLEKLARYEIHLDRKFERTLTVLLRLQEMRKAKTPDMPPAKLA